jgi:hypothetical protein
MSDDFEDLLKRWLRERGATDQSALRALAGHVAVLPPRRSRRPANLLAAAAVIVSLGLGAVALAPRFGSVAAPAASDAGVPDATGSIPIAFAGDPRLAACSPQFVAEPVTVFEMAHAQWFPLHFPGWWKGAPELELDDPALVVIGREQHWPRVAGPPPPGQTYPPDSDLGSEMCIAVGPASGFIVHGYGVTHFDRIVPVLSASDIERAAHLDPDVLADPAAWPFPERLAPCGGLTGNELYIFEANPLRDYPRYFPQAEPVPAFDVDDPAIIVVYRDPLPLRRAANEAPYGPADHDVCVVSEAANPNPDHAILPRVDITGFHLRIDGPAPSEPTPSESAGGPTPTPAPAWAGDARSALSCDGPPSTFGSDGPVGAERTDIQPSPDQAMRAYGEAVRLMDLPLPTSGFEPAETATGARLYAYRVSGEVKAAIVVGTVGGGTSTLWRVMSIATCDASEYDPATPIGGGITIWTDAAGNRVPTTILSETADCYQGTQLRLDGRLFVRVPFGGVSAEQLEVEYRADTTLPNDAVLQPYRDGSRRLYLAASGKAAFVVEGATVERWPHVIGDLVERTDCN